MLRAARGLRAVLRRHPQISGASWMTKDELEPLGKRSGELTVEVNEEVLRRCADGDGTSPFKIVVFVRRGLLLTLL